MMGLFDKLNGNGQPGQQTPQGQLAQITPDMMRQEVNSIQQNPAAYLSKRGFTIPQGMTDPRQITVHLLQSGQIGGEKVQQIFRMLGRR